MSPSIRNHPKSGILDFTIRARIAGWCRPKVLLNGHRASMAELNLHPPDELLAIELYENPNTAPRQYMRPEDYGCGLLMVWTKR